MLSTGAMRRVYLKHLSFILESWEILPEMMHTKKDETND